MKQKQDRNIHYLTGYLTHLFGEFIIIFGLIALHCQNNLRYCNIKNFNII